MSILPACVDCSQRKCRWQRITQNKPPASTVPILDSCSLLVCASKHEALPHTSNFARLIVTLAFRTMANMGAKNLSAGKT